MKPIPILCATIILGAWLSSPVHKPAVRNLVPLDYPVSHDTLPIKATLSYDGAIKPCGDSFCWTPEYPITHFYSLR